MMRDIGLTILLLVILFFLLRLVPMLLHTVFIASGLQFFFLSHAAEHTLSAAADGQGL